MAKVERKVNSAKFDMIGQEMVHLRDPLHSSVCYYGHNRLEVTVAFDSRQRRKPDTLHLWR
jgi:hypothetical protein